MSFHLALLLLVIGHLEVFKGFNAFQFIPHEIFLGKGFVGLALSLALLFFLFRRFHSPTRTYRAGRLIICSFCCF